MWLQRSRRHTHHDLTLLLLMRNIPIVGGQEGMVVAGQKEDGEGYTPFLCVDHTTHYTVKIGVNMLHQRYTGAVMSLTKIEALSNIMSTCTFIFTVQYPTRGSGVLHEIIARAPQCFFQHLLFE